MVPEGEPQGGKAAAAAFRRNETGNPAGPVFPPAILSEVSIAASDPLNGARPMPPMPLLDAAALAALAGLLLWAGACDARRYEIPNRIGLFIALLYPLHLLASGVRVDWQGGLSTAAALFALGAVLFFFRLFGGGDVKLLAAAGLWAGPSLAMPYLLVTALAGGALALFLIARRSGQRARGLAGGALDTATPPLAKQRMPYGVAIAAGGLFVAARLLRI